MGKRSAVRNNSGLPVDRSGPGLRVGPTTPATADRKSEACPPHVDVDLGVDVGVGVDVAVSLSLLAKVGESLRAELSAARVKRAASCGAQRRSSLLQFTNYRIIATGGF